MSEINRFTNLETITTNDSFNMNWNNVINKEYLDQLNISGGNHGDKTLNIFLWVIVAIFALYLISYIHSLYNK
jgi:hypothetical protein